MRAGRRPSTDLHSECLQHTLRMTEHTRSIAVWAQAPGLVGHDLADHIQDSACWSDNPEQLDWRIPACWHQLWLALHMAA